MYFVVDLPLRLLPHPEGTLTHAPLCFSLSYFHLVLSFSITHHQSVYVANTFAHGTMLKAARETSLLFS